MTKPKSFILSAAAEPYISETTKKTGNGLPEHTAGCMVTDVKKMAWVQISSFLTILYCISESVTGCVTFQLTLLLLISDFSYCPGNLMKLK